MDVILFLLKTLTRLALALTALLATLITGGLNLLLRRTANKAQPPHHPQEAQPAVPPSPALTIHAPPPVHVHVHVQTQPIGPAPSAPVQAVNRAAPSPGQILYRPDHGIYLTTGSHLMVPHPEAGDLLERLDRILYVTAHRHGDPFSAAAPQAATANLMLETPTESGDDTFFNDEGRPLPPPDGALWVRKAGDLARPLAALVPS